MKALLAALGMALAATVVAPVAHADEASFVQDMSDAGFTNGDGAKAEVAVGMQICSNLLAGATNYSEAHRLYLDSKLNSESEADQFVHIAIKDLCP